MYKKLFLLSTLSVGLAASPALMAKPGLEPHRTATSVIQQQYDRGQQQHQQQRGNARDDHGGRGNSSDNRGRNDHADRGGRGDRNDRDHDDRHDNDHRGNNRDRDWTRNERERHWQGARYRVASYHPPHGYQRHQWHHGDRLPASYRGHRYVVNDYHAYRLRTPPRGHQWVRIDRDVVLTVVATGVVAAVVYGIFQ